jgi:hypothetical protein
MSPSSNNFYFIFRFDPDNEGRISASELRQVNNSVADPDDFCPDPDPNFQIGPYTFRTKKGENMSILVAPDPESDLDPTGPESTGSRSTTMVNNKPFN